MRTMRLFNLLLAAALIGFSGCATQPLPGGLSSIRLSARSDAALRVAPPSLRNRAGRLVLEGALYKQPGAYSTRGGYLEIAFLDKAGDELRLNTTGYVVQNIAQRPRLPQRAGYYSVSINSLPTGTARIEVRAREQARTTGQSQGGVAHSL